MTLIDDLITIVGSFTVDESAGESAAYPVLKLEETTEAIAGDDDVSALTMTRIRWRIRSLALASAGAMSNVPDLLNTLRSSLAKRGVRLRVTELGGTPRDLPAAGASGGSIAGYPRINIETIDEGTIGPFVGFTLAAETVIPTAAAEADGFNLVEHTSQSITDIDHVGISTTTVRGEVRVRPDQVAEDYVNDVVVGPARTTAQGNYYTFKSRVTSGVDTAFASYEYVIGNPGSTGWGSAPNVFDAQVTDVTTADKVGLTRRIVSGWAEGTGSGPADFAADQKPTAGSGELLVMSEVSQPAVTSGRVQFRYEIIGGVSDGTFGGSIRVISFEQSIINVSGGREAVESSYAEDTPDIWLGENRPWRYIERGRLEFIGPFTSVSIPALMNTDNYASQPREMRRSRPNGTNVLEVTRSYIFDSSQSMPTPTSLTNAL